MAPPSEQRRDEVVAAESQPLLADAAARPQSPRPQSSPRKAQQHQQQQQRPSSPTKAAQGKQERAKSQELGQCRICLEEDALPALETPCGCTGTQRYAHKDCIQKWVNEKHHTTCEICDQAYKGDYVVPPAPPHAAGEALTLVSPIGNLYLTVDDERLAGRLLTDVYDEFDDHRQPTVSWCFSFMMLLLFMLFLQSAIGDVSTDPAAAAASGQAPPSSPAAAAAGGHGGSGDAGMAAPGLMAGLSLFLVWLVSKLVLAVFPMIMVMRLAARAQEQAAAEAAAAAGTVPGLDSPPHSGGGADSSSPEHPLAGLLARLAAAPAAAGVPRGGGSPRAAAAGGSGSSGGGSSTMADLEMEVLQARREALSRLGRDPTFWGHAAAAPSAPARAAAAVAPATAEQQQQQQQQQPAAQEGPQQGDAQAPAEQRVAALRALMHSIIRHAVAARRQGYEQPGQQQAPNAADGSGGSSSRVQGGVV